MIERLLEDPVIMPLELSGASSALMEAKLSIFQHLTFVYECNQYISDDSLHDFVHTQNQRYGS